MSEGGEARNHEGIERGAIVRYGRWTGRVYDVLRDGSVLIDWSGHTQGFDHPFFHGPYRLEELEASDV